MDDKALRDLISLFLKLNATPSDAQFHALAEAVGVDKERLESISYEMLGEEEGALVESYEVEINADSQDVLDDVDIDPNTISLDDAALNDGAPTNQDLGFQDETHDDGADVEDIGVGFNSDDVLTDDGAVGLEFEED